MRLTQVAGQAAYDFERQPAWCDRVLHSKVSVARKSCLDYRGLLELPFVSTREVAEIPMCRGYCALGGFTQSDHRPVCAAGPSAQWASEGCIFSPRHYWRPCCWRCHKQSRVQARERPRCCQARARNCPTCFPTAWLSRPPIPPFRPSPLRPLGSKVAEAFPVSVLQ